MTAAVHSAHTDRPALGLMLGDDGSPSGTIARRFLSSTRWPQGTWLRRAAAMEGLAPDHRQPAVEDVVRDHLHAGLTELADSGLVCSDVVLHGWAGAALVLEAARVHPDLVVVGSRSMSPSHLGLGPVSTSVVEHSQEAVLVVRRERVRTILVVADGSTTTPRAAAIVAALSQPTRAPIHLVSVVELPRTLRDVPYQSATWAVWPGTREGIESQRADRQRGLQEARRRLADTGSRVTIGTRVGSPATEILGMAEEMDADLVVMGRGSAEHAGHLGEVARDVVLNATASVLLVPEPP